jgi:DMSO/TMAO reductase YedYZ heme-binding membrane subunit
MTVLDLSSFAGLCAMVLLTLNVLMGVLISRNYNPARRWPRRKLPAPLFKIHNWTAYLALVFFLVHPSLLLFNATPNFALADILFPIHSPGQTLYNNLGAITFYAFLVVVVTSYFRPQLGSRPWKKIHFTAYFGALVMFIHGTLIDPNLKGQPPDFFDGEKVLVEGCFLLVVAAAVWRVRQKKKLI